MGQKIKDIIIGGFNMKIYIMGGSGSGKSTLAYFLNQKYRLPRLNLDEVARNPKTGKYYPKDFQQKYIHQFLESHLSWVIEVCQPDLYKIPKPDIIIFDLALVTLIGLNGCTTNISGDFVCFMNRSLPIMKKIC